MSSSASDRSIRRCRCGARPLETRYGYHAIWIDARVIGVPQDYEQVRDAIAGYLEEQGWRQAISQYLQWLASRARIKGVDLSDQTQTLLR